MNVALISGLQNSNFTINNLVLPNSNVTSLPNISNSCSGGVFGHVDSQTPNNINQYNGLQINTSVNSIASNNNSYSSGVIGYITNCDDLIINRCSIYNSTINSQSFSGASFAGAIQSICQQTNVFVADITVLNVQIKAICNDQICYSAGIVAYVEICQIQLSNVKVNNSIIQSIGSVSRSGGLMCFCDDSALNIYNSEINSSFIQGSFIGATIQQNQIYTTGPQTGGIIGTANNSNVFVTDTILQFTNISQICKQHAVSGGINGQIINSSSRVINVKIRNSIIICNSSELNTHSGGINAVVECSNDYQQNVNVNDLQIFSNSIQYNHNGGLNGYIIKSTVNISQVKIMYLNLQSQGINNNCGGILGAVVFSYQVNIQNSCIQNSNFTLNAYTNAAGAAICQQHETQSIIINNIVIRNIIFYIAGNSSSSGSFFSSIYSTNQQIRSLTQIQNSLIDSINIYSTAQFNYNNIISQCPNSAFGQIYISSTKSLGFSSINGVSIPNCEDVHVQLLDGSFFISDSGCI
ncbi:Hypothetical_protein [Hexamita inflata]|uniref:Hypothetical_protein n=1 Tax=Hexamita inflata TaxID=28002 RepID=A0AA86UL92_9EUKA|nr:Hypothetical protein HINF_LOCUS43456 [Hexamita inflata]